MHKPGLTGLFAALSLMASLGAAQAQFFNYSAVFSPNPFPTTLATSGINVTNGGNNSTFAGLGGSDISVASLRTFSSAPDNTPASITHAYNIAITLAPSDNLGNALAAAQTQNFTGTLSGTVSLNTANVSNAFDGQNLFYNFGSAGIFQVFLNGYSPPGAPGGTDAGSISAHVNGQLALQTTPEPGTVAMLFGMSVTGLMALRRRRARRK